MPQYKRILKTKDYLISQEEFELVHEPNTDMLITSPLPKNIETYYDSSSYISHQDKNKSLIDKIYYVVKSYTLNKKVKLITQYANNDKKLLDIGTGTGEFLNKAKNNNWNVVGVEPNSSAQGKAIAKDLNIVKSLDDLKQDIFQIITMWHVLEHIPNLEDEISKIEKLLSPEGTLIVAVPNFKSYDANYYKCHWAAYDVPRHLWHFSQTAIAKLFEKRGLKIVNTLPMIFDSYYVSLLSEKYKTNKTNYINAFFRGFLSNLKARSSGEYSSLIYVLQRA